MKGPTRRALMFGGASILGLGVAGGVAVIPPALDPRSAVISFIRRMVPDLVIDPADLAAFAAEIVDRNTMPQHKRVAHFALLENPGLVLAIPGSIAEAQDRNEARIITAFMQSTDYLDPDRGDEPTSFIVFADPYEVGCSNPVPDWTKAEVT